MDEGLRGSRVATIRFSPYPRKFTSNLVPGVQECMNFAYSTRLG